MDTLPNIRGEAIASAKALFIYIAWGCSNPLAPPKCLPQNALLKSYSHSQTIVKIRLQLPLGVCCNWDIFYGQDVGSQLFKTFSLNIVAIIRDRQTSYTTHMHSRNSWFCSLGLNAKGSFGKRHKLIYSNGTFFIPAKLQISPCMQSGP